MDDLESRRPVFLSDLFYAFVGNRITGGEFSEQNQRSITSYLETTNSEVGGFFSVEPSYIKVFPALGKAKESPMVPEVYSTYYGFQLARLVGAAGIVDDSKTLEWLLSLRRPSGLIYNASYSDTSEHLRMESEKCLQLYFALSLIKTLNRESLGTVESGARNWLQTSWAGIRTITARYFSIKAIEIVAPESLESFGDPGIRQLLESHREPETGLYYDYLLSDKVDESMGSKSATRLDKIIPHIFSTYYGAYIAKRLKLDGAFLSIDLAKILAKPNENGGFGHQVMIKDFGMGFGPSSTTLETILALLLPVLLS